MNVTVWITLAVNALQTIIEGLSVLRRNNESMAQKEIAEAWVSFFESQAEMLESKGADPQAVQTLKSLVDRAKDDLEHIEEKTEEAPPKPEPEPETPLPPSHTPHPHAPREPEKHEPAHHRGKSHK